MKMKTLIYVSLITLVTLLDPAANAQTFSVIHTFTGSSDGQYPEAGVSLRAGTVYGTAFTGFGSKGDVYQITHIGSDWITVPILLFSPSGYNPEARVIFGPDGHLYGTTSAGGVADAGVIFDLVPPLTICKTANCSWKENILYQFQAGFDGASPSGDVIWDQQGNIYGTTIFGGPSNDGTVYELTKSGSAWTESPIWSFTGSDGAHPVNGVVFDRNGNLFGTTQEGGAYGYGAIFKLTYIIGVGWTENTLYSFQNGSDGASPNAGLVLDPDSGSLYGATFNGGSGSGGTVFELSPAGDTWTFDVLYSFSGSPGGECGPWASLTLVAGSLYGTTACDGSNSEGNVFKLTKSGNNWAYTSLYDFIGGGDGSYPISNVTMDADGILYGTANRGGSQGLGTVWMIKP